MKSTTLTIICGIASVYAQTACECLDFEFPVCDTVTGRTFKNRCLAECENVLDVQQGACNGAVTIPAPVTAPIPAPVTTPVTAPPALVGSNRDEFGCIPSAGYSWCAALQSCIRSWETPCAAPAQPVQVASPTNRPASNPTPNPYVFCPVLSCYSDSRTTCKKGSEYKSPVTELGCKLCPQCVNQETGQATSPCPILTCFAVNSKDCPEGTNYDYEYNQADGCRMCQGCINSAGKMVAPRAKTWAPTPPTPKRCYCANIYSFVCDEKSKKTYNNECEAKCQGVSSTQLSKGSCTAGLADRYTYVGNGFCRDGQTKALTALLNSYVSSVATCSFNCDSTPGCIGISHNAVYGRCLLYGDMETRLSTLWQYFPGEGGKEVVSAIIPTEDLYARDAHCHARVGGASGKPSAKPATTPTNPATTVKTAPPAPCPSQEATKFELRSQMFQAKCLQVGKAKTKLALCKGSANQLFTLEDGVIKDSNGKCFSSSLNQQVCAGEGRPITMKPSNVGRQIQIGGDNCLNTKSAKVLEWVKCSKAVNRRQGFIFSTVVG